MIGSYNVDYEFYADDDALYLTFKPRSDEIEEIAQSKNDVCRGF